MHAGASSAPTDCPDSSTVSGYHSAVTPDLLAQVRRLGVVPMVTIDDPKQAGLVAQALAQGGLPCVEVTFRTAKAGEALERIAGQHPEVLLGAGTVLTPAQAAQAKAAGARFVVSPGFNPRVVEYCRAHDIPIFPGVCTPTDIEAALGFGLDVLKFFPAELMGGVAFIEAVAAPYAGIEFIPTGGITLEVLPDYLRCEKVLACGGSWVAPRPWIEAGSTDRIREAARHAAEAVTATRGRAAS